jgi:chromosome segregation ATPase
MKGGVRPNLSTSSLPRGSPARHSTGGSVNGSLCGDRDRRELHAASHNLSTDAGQQRVVLQVQKHNLALTNHVRESDEQLERTKAELRKARATIQQYEREDENLQRRLQQAHADKVSAQALAEESADRARKLDAKLSVGLHQRGMGAIQREAKAAEALLLLKERDEELAAARREAMLLRLSVSIILALSQSIWDHKVGGPGLFSAPKLTDMYRGPGMST